MVYDLGAELGYLPDVVLDLTPGELFRLYRMYNVRQSKEWERARFVAWYGSLPYRGKSDHTTPYDIMKLETDPTEEDLQMMRKQEEEEALAIIRSYKERGIIKDG